MEVRGYTLNFGAISRQGLSVIQSELAANSVGTTQIQANAVRTNELYIDGDLNMNGNNAIAGVDGFYYSASKATTYPHIYMTSTNMQVHSGTSTYNDLWLIAKDEVKIAADDDVRIETGDDIRLTASGNVILAGLVQADPHVPDALWDDNGTVKISAG